jgi:predicted transcriptional regulator of viral defense system
MRHERAPAEILIAALAKRQHGVVMLGDLEAAGLTRDGVKRRVAAGRLHRIHRGVYAVGHRGLADEGRWIAAVLACGEGAVLSHRSAAQLWRLLDPDPGPVDVSVPTRCGRRRRSGIRIHRPRAISVEATTRRRGIPVTTPARTIRDLRRVASGAVVRRALRQAEYLGLDLAELETDGTRSGLEAAVLLCVGATAYPRPR